MGGRGDGDLREQVSEVQVGLGYCGGGTDGRGKGGHPAQASRPSQTLALLLRALRRREGASTLGAYTYNPYSQSMGSSL